MAGAATEAPRHVSHTVRVPLRVKGMLSAAGIDAARTLACAGIVLAQANLWLRSGEIEAWWPFGPVGALFLIMTVPTFFLLSGFSAPIIFVAGRDVLALKGNASCRA